MLTRNGYGKAVDWWALGALCYEMLVGRPPFSGKTQKELDKKILFEKISVPAYLTAPAHSLLKGMLEKDVYVSPFIHCSFITSLPSSSYHSLVFLLYLPYMYIRVYVYTAIDGWPARRARCLPSEAFLP